MILELELAKIALSYNPKTGLFRWRYQASPTAPKGSIAGTLTKKGYVVITVLGRKYLAHRLAWMWANGEIPIEVDHLNGIKSDNRIKNLRNATPSINKQNVKSASVRSRTGVLGVSEIAPGRFRAGLTNKGKFIYLGLYDTPEEAHEAYAAGKRALHPGNTL